MFVVDTTNHKITMSRGDTGSFYVDASGYTFSSDDRALFTIKNSVGGIVYQRVYELDGELGNGRFRVDFNNPDTDTLATGDYSWDVRYILHPYYLDGKIVSGDQVITPNHPMTMTLLITVGEV